MTRETIQLYNTDKYQALFPAPKVNEVRGDASEVIISADQNENSSSNNTVGSITMNASGGVFYDTGFITAYNTFTHTKTTDGAEPIVSFDITKYRSARINVTLQYGASFATQDVYVVHNTSSLGIRYTTPAEAGASISTTYTGSVTNGFAELNLTSPTGTVVKGVVNLVLV